VAIGKRVKVTRNHQTTVPKEARENFGIEIGSVLEFRVRHRFGTESHRESVRPRVRRLLEDGREGLGGLPVSWLRIGAREASGLRENAHPRTQIRPLLSPHVYHRLLGERRARNLLKTHKFRTHFRTPRDLLMNLGGRVGAGIRVESDL